MALVITITNAGRAEMVAADNTGTEKVTITAVAFGTGQYTPSKSQTALQAEVARVDSIAGQVVADDTIHVMALDESSAAYNVGEFGLISDKGTLIAVYSQLPAAGWILQKAAPSTLLLATDIILESLDATVIEFGDISFINPPATETTPGVTTLVNNLETNSSTAALTAAMGMRLQEEKEPSIAPGTTAQYWRGNKGWRDFATDVRAALLTGLSTASAAAIAATDSVLSALGKLQAQITGLANSKLDATANAVSATKLQTARTIGGVQFDGTTNINLPGVNAAGNQNTSGNAATATKLQAARTLSISGAGTGNASFDGSANANIALTLVDSGAAAGTYTKVTINAKGLVTIGSTLVAGDIPPLPWSKITSGKPTTLEGYGITDGWSTANLEKQTSTYDATVGRVQLVGSYGWAARKANQNVDFNLVSGTGVYGLDTTHESPSTNTPADGQGVMLHLSYAQSVEAQLTFLNSLGNRLFFRTRYSTTEGVWRAPVELWHTGNFDPGALVSAGAIVHYARSTPPNGWLKANGAAVSRTTYAALFAAIGTTFGAGNGSTTFNLPDLRGEFLRGWDDGRGVDSARALGTAQADEFKRHRHPQYEYDTGNSVPIPDGSFAYDLNASITTGYDRTALIGYAGGAETRPRNIALLACIKY